MRQSIMSARDPRVDAYIARAADFARPILSHIREAVHKGCPDVKEAIKWGAPFFTRKGILCNMAAFKAHCTFGFWNADVVLGKEAAIKFEAMGDFGRITSVKDLPSERILIEFVKEAARRDESGVKAPAKPRSAPKPALEPPDELLAALKKNKKAAATFENFSPSHRREYVEWIIEAKRPETREKRVQQTLAWLSEGKPRHWKYQNC